MTITDSPIEGIDLLAATWGRGVPHDQFDRLRAEAPVYWHPESADTGFWAITTSPSAGSQALSAGRIRLTGPQGGP